MFALAPPATLPPTEPGYEAAFQQPLCEAMAAGGWQSLLAVMGANMAESVRQTLDGLAELARSRRIGAYEDRWMRLPLQQLYQSGIAAQRLSLLAGRTLPSAQEAVALNEILAETVADHRQRWPTHNIACRLDSLDVMSQPESLASVADSLLGWGCALGQELELELSHQPGEPHATLTLRVSKLQGSDVADSHLDSIQWLLLWQLARLEGIKVWRSVTPEGLCALLQFDRVMQRHAGLAVLESESSAYANASGPETAAVWCVTPSRPTAVSVVTTLAQHLPSARMIDSVGALAAELPDTPDCILSTHDVVCADSFRQWRHRAQALRGRSVAVIEISPEDGVFEVGGFGPESMGRISAGALTPRLLGAVVSEMGRLTESMP